MDASRFDELTANVTRSATRRGVIAALVGAVVLGRPRAFAESKKRRRVGAEDASSCYSGTRCEPGKGRNTSGCDFSGSAVFRNLSARGANISNANFTAANLQGADLRAANLSGSCFIVANLSGARIGAANLHNAVFCGTIMPDGSTNNSGCGRQTACCQCPNGDCTRTPNDQPDCPAVLLRAGCNLVFDAQIGVAKWVCPKRANLRNADLSGCRLTHAILDEVLFESAFLNRAILNDAHLINAHMTFATMDNITAVNARFDSAVLTRASMADSDLRNAVFQNALLVLRDWRRITCPDGTSTVGPGGSILTCCRHLNGHTAKQCGFA